MKIATLAIFALLGFWIVGAIVEAIQKRNGRSGGPQARPEPRHAGGAPEAEAIPPADPIAEACDVLGLARPFSRAELVAAYRRRISQYHPDKVGTLAQEFQALAERKTKEINRAYDLLDRIAR